MVKTLGSQPRDMGSTPVAATTKRTAMTLTSPWCCSGNSNEKSKGKALVEDWASVRFRPCRWRDEMVNPVGTEVICTNEEKTYVR